MILSDVSVKRPVLASVVSLLLIVFGVICSLPLAGISRYRSAVRDRTPAIGGFIAVVETRVTQVIEESIAEWRAFGPSPRSRKTVDPGFIEFNIGRNGRRRQ